MVQRLEQLELLLFLIVSVTFQTVSDLQSIEVYSNKFESECLELQHPIISIYGSRFISYICYLGELALILRTSFNIQAGEGYCLDGA